LQTSSTDVPLPEHAGYLPVAGVHLYTVLHEVTNPLARVLLVGPFASERHNSYLPWVRWARYLAQRRIEVLRYDYRGVGESTGVFEEMKFEHWADDIVQLVSWLQDRSGAAPLVLHGLEIGALLAGRAFHRGYGDALMLWSPPVNAHKALRSTLLRWINLERFSRPAGDQRTPADYIKELEQKSFIEVEGYRWSNALWRDSEQIDLPFAADGETASLACGRPVRIVHLERQAAPLVKGGFVGYDEAKDFDWLFAPNCDWITASSHRFEGTLA
jgi:pimeloyl-ACP methyl ester carboxylesterase